MVNCGWSPRDMSAPIEHMLDRTRNIEAAQLPELEEIILDEEAREVEVVFASALNQEMFDIFKKLIAREAERKGGVRFKAIVSVELGERGDSVLLKMMKPDKPTLKEVMPGHYVSCLIYDRPDVVKKGIYAEEAVRVRQSIVQARS